MSTTDPRQILIRAAAHSALAATACAYPHLGIGVMVERLDMADDGKVYAIDPQTGKFRKGSLGRKVSPYRLATELAKHPDTCDAWRKTR